MLVMEKVLIILNTAVNLRELLQGNIWWMAWEAKKGGGRCISKDYMKLKKKESFI